MLGGEEPPLDHMVEKGEQRIEVAATFRRPHGFRCSPSCPHVNISNSSSRVPKAPGRAMTPSDSSDISIFRSCIESTTRSSVNPGWAISRDVRCPGITPMIRPPWARTASARTPIMPTCAPPKTTVCPRAASRAPSSRPAEANSSPAPTLDPVKTQIRVMAVLFQRYHAVRRGWEGGRRERRRLRTGEPPAPAAAGCCSCMTARESKPPGGRVVTAGVDREQPAPGRPLPERGVRDTCDRRATRAAGRPRSNAAGLSAAGLRHSPAPLSAP